MNRKITLKKRKCSVLLSMNRTEDRHQLIVNMNTNLLAGDGEMLAACIPEREGKKESTGRAVFQPQHAPPLFPT